MRGNSLSFRESWLVLILAAFAPSIVLADAPVAIYLFPAGGQRGTDVPFRLGGYDLHDGCPFEMTGQGIVPSQRVEPAAQTIWFEGPLIPLPDSQAQESYPRDQIASVAISKDAPLGFRKARVRNSQGVSNWLNFVVDIWSFEARAGVTYTCEVMAERFGSALDSRLSVVGPNGKVIGENEDHYGKDSLLHFTATEDGPIQVRIQDVDFGGLQHFVYRLTITDGPFIDSIYPLGGRRGSNVAFQVAGSNLPDSPVTLQLPAVLPELSELTWSTQIAIAGRQSNPVRLELSD